jgi:catechol 2,3-dioxygenase-like lactoylglutathione lyase family enzyme
VEQRVSLVTLGVSDLARARRFYEDGLGWRRGNTEDGVAFYEIPGGIFALWSRPALAEDAGVEDVGAGAGGFAGVALAYNTRSKAEVDSVLAEAARAGARILKPGQDAFWGGYTGYFADPDGHVWEVAWNPHWTVEVDGRVRLSA